MDTRVALNEFLRNAWAESNSLRLTGTDTVPNRRKARASAYTIQCELDQAQQALDDFRDHLEQLDARL